MVTGTPDAARLVVSDDGRGFNAEERARRVDEGHLGLSLLEELVRQAGGDDRDPLGRRQGNHVELEVPAR